MKFLIFILVVLFSFAACGLDKVQAKKITKKKVIKIEMIKVGAPAVPCESKEDILKKIEEKKKTEEGKVKAFSLQGGDTGCKLK